MLAPVAALLWAAPASAQLVADAGDDIVVECAGREGTAVNLDGTGSSMGADVHYTWTAPGVRFDDRTSLTPVGVFPPGTTTATLTVRAGDPNAPAEASDQVEVTVVDTIAPSASVRAQPDELWPPNHELVEIAVRVRPRDACDGDPSVTLLRVESDEPDNGTGDGNTVDDIQEADVGTDDRRFLLRAERQGSGDGRVYTIEYLVVDGAGNETHAVDLVHVPHDQRDRRDHDDDGLDDVAPMSCPIALESVAEWSSALPSPRAFSTHRNCRSACRAWASGCRRIASAANRCAKTEELAANLLSRVLCREEPSRTEQRECVRDLRVDYSEDRAALREDLLRARAICADEAEDCSRACERAF